MRTLSTLLALSFFVVAIGCDSQPDNSVNNLGLADVPVATGGDATGGDTGTSPDAGAQTDTGVQTDATGGGTCDCLSPGIWFRFDSLGLTSLDGAIHPVIGQLNPMWITDMDAMELNILFEVLEVSADNVTFRAVNAARVGTEGDICVLEDSAVTFDFPREGCTLKDSTASAINVYAGDEAHPKNCTTVLPVPHAIPVQQVVLEARLSDDCGRIDDGIVLSGVIGEQELLGTCTCLLFGGQLSDACGALEPDYVSDEGLCAGCNDGYLNLAGLLNTFGTLDYKCTTVDGNKGVCIEGTFSAAVMDAAPPSCGQ